MNGCRSRASIAEQLGNGSSRKYQRNIAFGLRYTANWDDPELGSPVPEAIHPK
jgi:hypothetical protein